MKLGFSVKLDVKKIDKERLFKGQKGTYLDLVMFVDTDQQSQYGDNGTLSQSVTKEERENGVKLPIIGNAKLFWTNGPQESQVQQGGYQPPQPGPAQGGGYQGQSQNQYNQPGQPGYNPTNPAPPGPVGPDDVPF